MQSCTRICLENHLPDYINCGSDEMCDSTMLHTDLHQTVSLISLPQLLLHSVHMHAHSRTIVVSLQAFHVYCKNIWVTSTVFLLSQLHACCVHVTHYKLQGYQFHPNAECSWEASPFCILVAFRRLIAFLVGLVFLSYTSAPGGVPWLHSCGRNARSVTKQYICFL